MIQLPLKIDTNGEEGDVIHTHLLSRKSHFNCFKIELAHVLLAYEYETAHLFYNAYESTNAINQELLVERKGFWLFHMDCMNDNDLAQIGANFTDFKGSSTTEAAQYIEANLQTGNVVFSGVKPKHFPELHFMDGESMHYIIIEQFMNNQHAIISDIKNIVSKTYEADFVLQVVQDSNYPLFSLHRKDIRISPEIKNEFRSRARQFILHNEDNSSLFDHALDIVNMLPHSTLEAAKPLFYTLGQVFIMLSGSRYVFSCYMELQPVPAYVVDLLRHCSDQAESIKNIIIKKDIQLKTTNHPLQIDQLVEKIELLRDYERLTLLALKKELANE